MESKYSAAIASFSARFINEVDKTRNVVCSPLSAELVLALLTLGSTDPARQQLLNSLGLTDDDSIRSAFSIISSKIKSLKAITLNMTNMVYIKEGPYDLHPRLKQDAVEVFNTAVEKVDFDDGEAVSKKINTWVETQTNNKIQDMVSENSFNSNTRLVLLNVLYFKGIWKVPFFEYLTHEQEFHLNANSTVQIPMMYKKDDFLYGCNDHLQVQLLSIPFMDDEASMLIVLPRDIEGLNDVVTELAAGYNLMKAIEEMSTTKVRVIIPKFKIQTEIDLTQLLPKLGISAIFDWKNSGLTKLLNNGAPLFVTTAVQKAFIELNEEGVEAAVTFAPYLSAKVLGTMLPIECLRNFLPTRIKAMLAPYLVSPTINFGDVCNFGLLHHKLRRLLNNCIRFMFKLQMMLQKRSLKPPVPEFRADRPYLYLLLDADRTPLFIGVYRGVK